MFDEQLWAGPLLDFIDELHRTGPGRRGKTYAEDGHVYRLRAESNCEVVAHVDGSEPEPYEVSLQVNELGIASVCSCPYVYDCKHGYAVALVLLAEGCRRGRRWASGGVRYLPTAWQKGRYGTLAQLKRYLEDLFQDEPVPTQDVLLPGLGDDWWRHYIHAPDSYETVEALVRDLTRILPAFSSRWFLENAAAKVVSEALPIERMRTLAREFKQVALIVANRKKTSIPGLDEFLTSDEAREIEMNHLRGEAQASLLRWLNVQQDIVKGELSYLDVVWTFEPSGKIQNLPRLGFQVLLTGKKLRQSPRTIQNLEILCREADNGRRLFGPDEHRFLRWLVDSRHLAMVYGSATQQDTFVPIRNAFEWMSQWGGRDMIRWDDGAPVEYGVEPARLTVADCEGGPEWMIQYPGEDAPVPVAQAQFGIERGTGEEYGLPNTPNRRVYTRHGNLLRLLETGGMPEEVLVGIRLVPKVPLDLLRGTAAGARLAHRLLPRASQPGTNELISEVPVRVKVVCRLVDNALVHFSAQAEGPENLQFIWTHQGEWALAEHAEAHDPALENLADTASPANEPDKAQLPVHTLAHVPRSADVQPINEWLATMPRDAKYLTTPEGGGAVEWRVRGANLYDLLDLWSRRPVGVSYLGDRAFRSLVTPGNAPAVRVRTEPSGTDWLKVSVELEQDIKSLSLEDIAEALQASQTELVYLTGGRLYRREDLEAFQRQVSALEEMGVELDAGEQRVHALQAAGARAEALEELEGAEESLTALANRARAIVKAFKGVPSAPVPKATAGFLRPYQRAGADFLVWAARTMGGAVLADDMGLGKTLQVLAALTALRAKNKAAPPSLVVCPASVAHNWKREANRFAPNLRVVVIERGSDRKHILNNLDQYDLVIKNYALTRREADTLREREWLAICVDEAQAIKNPGADITRTVKSIPAKYRFALTGTPIENRLTDLWSIVDFVLPGYLQSLKRFEQRLRDKDSQNLQRIVRARLRPALLRRTKAEVAPELPPRIEERRDCEMPVAQRKAYVTEVQKTRLLLEGFEPSGRKGAQGRIKILAALTRLRQICCDPALVGMPNTGSGKVNLLLELIPPILEQGHKILLFSQFVRMLKILETTLGDKGIRTRMLTGQTTSRQELVDAFEADPEPSVFLISLKAGGVGLNLPSASHVILFDPWWNPAVEAQAIDRTHRIGQDKTVIAFRLVSEGTVEERILELQERKRSLVTEMLEEEAFNRTLSKEDFAFLLEN